MWMCFIQYPDGVFPLDIAIGLPMAAFLIAEILISRRTLNVIIAKQTADFIELVHMEAAMKKTFPGFDRETEILGLRQRRGAVMNDPPGAQLNSETISSSTRPANNARSGGGSEASTTSGLPPRPPLSNLGTTASEYALGKVGVRDLAREGVAGIRKVLGGGLALNPTTYAATSRKLAEELAQTGGGGGEKDRNQ